MVLGTFWRLNNEMMGCKMLVRGKIMNWIEMENWEKTRSLFERLKMEAGKDGKGIFYQK